jgi:hypothetical protein
VACTARCHARDSSPVDPSNHTPPPNVRLPPHRARRPVSLQCSARACRAPAGRSDTTAAASRRRSCPTLETAITAGQQLWPGSGTPQAAVELNEAGGARGGHRPSPARSSGIQRALHVVVMGLGVGVRWASTQVPDTRLPRRCRAWRARFSRTEPHSRGAVLLCRAAPGRAGVRVPHPRRGTGIGQEARLAPVVGRPSATVNRGTWPHQIRAHGQRIGEDRAGQRQAGSVPALSGAAGQPELTAAYARTRTPPRRRPAPTDPAAAARLPYLERRHRPG